jgi:hypothetical protein
MALPWLAQALIQAEIERRQKEEEERIANNERAEAEREAAIDRAEAQRTQALIEEQIKLQREALERERIAEEKERLEAERIEKERLEAEKEAKIQAEKDKWSANQVYKFDQDEYQKALQYYTSLNSKKESSEEANYLDGTDKGEYGF